MQKSVKSSDLKSVDKQPTNVKGWNPDPDGRVSSAVTKEGEFIYIYDGKEKLSDEDGFGMLTGRATVPNYRDGVSSCSHISDEKWKTIFGGKK